MGLAADRTMDFFDEECDNADLTTEDRVEELHELIEDAQTKINKLENAR